MTQRTRYPADIVLRSITMLPLTSSQMLLILVVILSCCAQMLLSDCPRLCECKWKSGKESVLCLNANLSVVPLHLNAGTQVLDLTANNLVTVKHEEFSQAGLLHLQKIYISKCRLKNLERYAFKDLKNLVDLDLSYNVLSAIPSHVFDSIPELRELKLSGNPIQRVANNAFVNVPQLIRLELSDCKINVIEKRAFYGLEKSLEWLKLDKNKLSEVISSSFTILHSLHGLELAENPWNCSCLLRPLREWMLRQNVPFGIPPVCHYPKRLALKPWDKLDLDEFACVPEILASDSKAHGVEGKNVTMTCHIAGVPEPNVRWLLKNKVIANLSGSPYSNGRKLYIVHLQNNASDLTILTADVQDAGVYVCAAENKAGRAEASVTLAVSRKPPETISLSNRVLIASVIVGTLFVLASCLTVVCVCAVRKKPVRWRNRECRREDNYEKIEMNHKVTGSANGGALQGDIAVVGVNRRNGEYRVVPGADTDPEIEEEEETTIETPAVQLPKPQNNKTWNSSHNDNTTEKRWNSPDHMLDPEDLHIPRRTLKETRDDFKKTSSSTSGIYNNKYTLPSTSVRPLSQTMQPHHTRKQMPDGSSGSMYTSAFPSELSSLVEDDPEKKYPDLIENSPTSFKINIPGALTKASSEGGSVTDITDLFCTLPRKRTLVQSARYNSTDSQSPLLPESRYASSGGDSSGGGSHYSSTRRLSDSQRYSLTNLNKNRVNKMSNSYLNLTSTKESSISPSPIHEVQLSSTPLLDVSSLENRVFFKREVMSPTPSPITTNANAYDYHAAQLERFLEEYRTLQKELTKMKETCDNLRQDRTKYLDPLLQQRSTPVTPSSDEGNSKSILKKNTLPVQQQHSPNSNHQPLDNALGFHNFDSDLTNYLLSKTSPQNFNNSAGGGVFKS